MKITNTYNLKRVLKKLVLKFIETCFKSGLLMLVFPIVILSSVNYCRANNNPPIAVNDTAFACENGGAINIFVQNNDSDIDLNILSTNIILMPKNGTATLNVNSIDYTPNINFTGKDTIFYSVCDNGTPSLCASAKVIIIVNPKPLANAGVDQTICAGQSAALGVPPCCVCTYNWSPATGLSSNIISNPMASPLVTTTYIVTVTSSETACQNMDTVVVTVKSSPTVNTGQNRSICLGDTTTIGATPIAGLNYNWVPSSGLNLNNISQPISSPQNSILYYLTVTDTISGCQKSDTVRVVVHLLPTAEAGMDKIICSGESVELGVECWLGNYYLWTPAIGLDSNTVGHTNASPQNSTTYTLIVTDTANLCQKRDTVIVNVNPLPTANAGSDKAICVGDSVIIGSPSVPEYTYEWFGWLSNSGLSSHYIAQPNASPSITSYYILTETNNSTTCSKTDTVKVVVNPLPVSNAGSDKIVCTKDSTNIGMPPVQGNAYSWFPLSGLSSGIASQPNVTALLTSNYVLTTSNILTGCYSKDTVLLTVNPLPVAVAGQNQNICSGDSIVLGNSPVVGNTYNWEPITGLCVNTVSQINASPNSSTTYTLTVENILTGCVNKDSVKISLFALPNANVGSDKTICSGSNTIIGATPEAGSIYSWSPTYGLSSSVVSQPNASPSVTTTYTLTEQSGVCSETSSNEITVFVNKTPLAHTGTEQTVCEGGSVILGGSNNDENTYKWTPELGLNSSTISSPIANPSNNTVYTLTEMNINTGCSATNEVLVMVEKGGFYNAFSPNGDDLNDWWNVPMLNCYQLNSVKIINRWGSEIWNGVNYDNENVKWTGQNMNGIDVVDGTYYYIIKYNGFEKRGWVFVKR